MFFNAADNLVLSASGKGPKSSRWVNEVAESLVNLPFVDNRCFYPDIFVQDDVSFFALYFIGSFYLLDHEPFFEVSFATVQVGLFFGPEAFFLQFVPDLTARNPKRKSLKHLYYS
jgi:hypothetical protein